MVYTDGPVMEDDLSMGTNEYSLGGGHEGDDYGGPWLPLCGP